VDEYEQRAVEPVAPQGVEFEKHPDELSHSEARGLTSAPAYTGCEHRCAGISWYCIENKHCFEEK